MTLSAITDLSVGWGAARSQGSRPTCLAFALSELNQRANKRSSHLSPEYLYRAAARRMAVWPQVGLELGAALAAVKIDGQPDETVCAYTLADPAENPPALPTITSPLHRFKIDPRLLSVQSVIGHLGQGVPVGLIIKITKSFYTPSPSDGIVAYSSFVIPDEHHAVVATGHGVDPANGDVYIAIRNSWGVNWGLAGSAWLPSAYIDQHVVAAFSA